MSKHNVARTIGFTIFPPTQLILNLAVDMSKKNVARTNGFTTFPPKQLIFHLTVDISKNKMQELLVLQHFQPNYLIWHSAVDIFKNNVVKTNGFSNIVLGAGVKPMVLGNIVFEAVVKPIVLATFCMTDDVNPHAMQAGPRSYPRVPLERLHVVAVHVHSRRRQNLQLVPQAQRHSSVIWARGYQL